ncbi:MAG: glycoside hydrolase, partial [Gammaproteobacteria bacterium]|nr:glycoside hydrolase [Gammaproteobacteria bacterium]
SGAAVTGPDMIGAFSAPQSIPGASECTVGDVAIAPSGAVVQTCQKPIAVANSTAKGPTTIQVNMDPDGLGAASFGSTIAVTATNVGLLDSIPPQDFRWVDAEAGLAYDRFPTSPQFGRLYLVYTDETELENNDTDIMLRYSDDDGTTWSDPPIRVNDDSSTPIRSQFLPRIASDPQSGNVAVCWHDARHSAANRAMQEFCSFASPNGVAPAFSANIAVGDALSASSGYGNEFGDYSGLTFSHGVAHAIWGDTSNSTGDNPDGTLEFDAYTDQIDGQPPLDICEPCIPITTIIWITLIVIVIIVILLIAGIRWLVTRRYLKW